MKAFGKRPTAIGSRVHRLSLVTLTAGALALALVTPVSAASYNGPQGSTIVTRGATCYTESDGSAGWTAQTLTITSPIISAKPSSWSYPNPTIRTVRVWTKVWRSTGGSWVQYGQETYQDAGITNIGGTFYSPHNDVHLSIPLSSGTQWFAAQTAVQLFDSSNRFVAGTSYLNEVSTTTRDSKSLLASGIWKRDPTEVVPGVCQFRAVFR